MLIRSIFAGKTTLALKRSCNFSREKSNELTDQQDMLYYKTTYFLPCVATFMDTDCDSANVAGNRGYYMPTLIIAVYVIYYPLITN